MIHSFSNQQCVGHHTAEKELRRHHFLSWQADLNVYVSHTKQQLGEAGYDMKNSYPAKESVIRRARRPRRSNAITPSLSDLYNCSDDTSHTSSALYNNC